MPHARLQVLRIHVREMKALATDPAILALASSCERLIEARPTPAGPTSSVLVRLFCPAPAPDTPHLHFFRVVASSHPYLCLPPRRDRTRTGTCRRGSGTP